MKELNVLYLSDNNYIPYAGVSIQSMLINNKHIDLFNIYVIDDGISPNNKDILMNMINSYGHKVFFLDLHSSVEFLNQLKIPKYRNSYTTYLKLFAFGLLPQNVNRILFIDSDTIIVDDLSELIDLDMDDKMIGAVRDGTCHPYKMALGFDKNDSWFNMGVMLLDVSKWRAENAESKIIAQLKIRKNYVSVDQDLLNITQHGNIYSLHPKFNDMPHHFVYSEISFRRAFRQGGYYEDLAIMEEAKAKPVIYHFERFVGQSAWDLNTVHPFARVFDEYLEKSPWRMLNKKESNLSGILKIENKLYRALPRNLFIYIYAFGFKRYLLRMNKKMIKENGSLENIT